MKPISARLLAAIPLDGLLPCFLPTDASVSMSLSLMRVDEYLTEAAHLQRRIRRAYRKAASEMTKAAMLSSRRPKPFPFAAIHFYANCWSITWRHLELIRDLSGLREVGRALRPHNRAFSSYNDLRNHYEHFIDRLPGQKQNTRLAKRTDLGNLAGTTLTFGGVKYEIGPSSLAALRAIVAEVLTAFKLGALEKLASDRPADFARVIRRAHTDLHVRKLQRQFRSQGV